MKREEAIEVLNMIETHGSLPTKAKEMAIKALEERPKGKWININEDRVMCNKCTFIHEKWFVNFKYCPNCGAEMEVE